MGAHRVDRRRAFARVATMKRHTRVASMASTKISSLTVSGHHHGKNGVWTEEEDLLLATWQKKVGNKWSEVAKQIPGKTGQQCAQRWRHRVNPNIKRDKWDEHEDELLTRLVQEHGNHWATIARHVPGRTDQQCMGRWKRHLDPSIKREKWTVDEDIKLCALYLKYDNAWSSISRALEGRTPQQCRTRWHNLKTTSFMTRHQRDIQNIDIDAIEQAAVEKIDSGKRYHFAGSSSPAEDYGMLEENFQHNIARQNTMTMPGKRQSTALNSKDFDSLNNKQQRKRRGRPVKVVVQGDAQVPVEKSTRARGRPRKQSTRLETPPNVIESRMTALPILDFVQDADQRKHPKKRLSFESGLDDFPLLHGGGAIRNPSSKRARYIGGTDRDILDDEDDDSWIAGYDMERFNSKPGYGVEHNDVDEGIMLPMSTNTMLAMTPPKPKSKRQLLECQKFAKATFGQNEDSVLGLEDVVGQDFAGSRTPLSALRHAPKSCFSPALVDLLRSPPVTHDTFQNRPAGFQGFGSPAQHHNRFQHLSWNPNLTPNRNHTQLDVVRCLDEDIEWAGERTENHQSINLDLDSKHETFMPGTMQHPTLTPGTIGMHPPLVLDSTPRVATGSVMMKSHPERSGDGCSMGVPRYITVQPPSLVGTTTAGDSKLLPVKVVPGPDGVSTKDLVPMPEATRGENAFSQTSFSLSKGLHDTSIPTTLDYVEQHELLKSRTRRLSSASVRMCLHAILENA